VWCQLISAVESLEEALRHTTVQVGSSEYITYTNWTHSSRAHCMLVATRAYLGSTKRWRGAFTKTQSRHSLPVLSRVRGASVVLQAHLLAKLDGCGGGEDDNRVRRVFQRRSNLKLVGVKDGSHKNTKVRFSKATGRHTYALEIGSRLAKVGPVRGTISKGALLDSDKRLESASTFAVVFYQSLSLHD